MNTVSEQALDALAAAGRRAAEERDLDQALRTVAEAAADALDAEIVVVRVVDGLDQLAARTVVARSETFAAELEGSSFPLAELPFGEAAGPERLPQAVRRAAARVRAEGVLLLPVRAGDRPLGSLELMRSRRPFGSREALLARLAAAHFGLVLRAFETNGAEHEGAALARSLDLAGDALAAGLDQARSADQIVRVAVGATGAQGALLWRTTPQGSPELVASAGVVEASLDTAASAVARALTEQQPVHLEDDGSGTGRVVATLRLGQPSLGALQLLFPSDGAFSRAELGRLATFGVRAAQALRASERTRAMSLELERTQALLGVVGQAISQLSLAHALETAVERVSELLRAERVVIYLLEETGLRTAAGRGPAGPDLAVAERLLELALGPFRAEGMLHVTEAEADLRLAGLGAAIRESGIEGALGVPLVAGEELIGLLAVYLPGGRGLTANESALLAALGGQLAVAVQNARLHEQAKRERAESEQARTEAEAKGRVLRALHQISSSFADNLSLQVTLEAVARAAVELLGVDAAVLRTLDERRELLVPRASHVADPKLEAPLRPLLWREQAVEKLPGRRLFRMGRPLVLDPASARRLGSSYELLTPFLEHGSTAVVVPIATPAELLATLTVVSLDPARRIGEDALQTAVSVAGQAALAIDNARLYQQQKDFADTMRRSLLPQELPELPGLDVGAFDAPSSRVEVGGDVYDFLPLADGRLAVVLGDVTGHGIAATAEMALAKFVFRSLAREYPDPADFLAHANEVALGELPSGSFLTMVALAVDPGRGELALASAGHPPARLLQADGMVSSLAAPGLALGVEPEQQYEEVRRPFPPGTTVCLYTDGLIEARRDGELYGEERLDAVLAAGRDLPAAELAERLVADCRSFAGGELVDDCAVVVVRRT